MNKKKVIVVGAGPAGMMAAGVAAKNGHDVTLIDKNSRVGRKLMITGKGRCNITNNCTIQTFISSVISNGKFLYSAINNFTPQDTIKFFEDNGLKVKVERGNRVFPESDKAVDVVDTLNKFIKNNNCKLMQGKVTKLIVEENTIKGVIVDGNKKVYSDIVVIACGGKSYPLTGSVGDGYELAKSVGHTVVKLKPSLVPLISDNKFCAELQGLSLKNVAIKVVDQKSKKIKYEDFGEMIFTHFGVSGPIILSASSHMDNMEDSKYVVKIDLKPGLTKEKLDIRLQRDLLKYKNKDISNSLFELLPKKIIPVVINRLNIPEDTKCNQITKETRLSLVDLLKEFSVNIAGFRPIEEAIVTSGGVNTCEINPKTMESKLVSGLYFAGEVIDVDAYTGGFNLQIAFSTGYLAGNSI